MRKDIFLRRKKVVRLITPTIAFIVAIILISSSSISITLKNTSEIKNYNSEEIVEVTQDEVLSLTGLAPNDAQNKPLLTNLINSDIGAGSILSILEVSLPFGENMYGYAAALGPHGEGPCYWDSEDPGDIIQLSTETLPNFAAGGTWTCYEQWLVCEYSNGAIYEIDPETGDISEIGGGETGLNGLCIDPTANTLYGCSSYDLYQIDPEDGSQEYIGPFNSGQAHVAIECSPDGTMYSWDIKHSGDSYLYEIDKETGEAMELFSLGKTLTYAQDGFWCRAEDRLYLTAYITYPESGGYLAYVDFDNEALELVGEFEGSAEITGSMYKYSGFHPEHDVGVKKIVKPEDGDAGEEMEVIVQVKNYGNNSEEDVPVNVVILKDGVDEEYNETVYIDIERFETLDVEMPEWTPDDWQNESNGYIDYKITANTMLQGDDNRYNDYKEKWFELFFGYMHDVGCTEIISPKSGPAQTFPVNATIKNFGQHEESSFKTYIEIAEIDFETSEELFTESFSSCDPWPPNGWTRTHANWECSNSNKAGGTSPEARFYYYPIQYPQTYRLISPVIDTTDFGAIQVEFQHAQTRDLYGTYTMELETSTDGVTWESVWDRTGPIPAEKVTLVTGENVGGSEFRISFSVKTESYSMLYWYIDDIVITGYTCFNPEYKENINITKIEPGEELELEFDDWTPDYLQYETTGIKSYLARLWTELKDPEDNNPANDEIRKHLTLNFFHDVGIREMDSPKFISGERKFYAVDCSGYPSNSRMVWFDPEDPGIFHDIGRWPNTNFPQGATFVCDKELWFCDTNGNIFKKTDPLSEEYETVGSAGTGELVGLSYHEKTKVLYGMSTKNLYTIDMETGKATLVGSMGNPGLMISLDCDEWSGIMYAYELDFTSGDFYTIDLETGRATKIGETGISLYYGQDMAYDCIDEKMYVCAFNYATFEPELYCIDLETGEFYYIGRLGGHISAFAIPGCCFSPSAYVQPGNQDIIAIAENVGTFPEKDMTCTVEINEYITDCDNGTLVYEDLIEDIDILTPLVGEETLTFDDYNFAQEGFYGIFVNITDDNDDNLENNNIVWGVGCDATEPSSTHTLDPPEPDGLNGWYVNDLEVTICAEDPYIGCGHRGSGIKEIIVNGQSFPGDCVTIKITDDGVHNIRYYAIDNVGNEESMHEFSIKMDQTGPDMKLKYEVIGNPIQGWDILFTAEPMDATSGMERVEMYINEGLVETIIGPGPLYEFIIEWSNVMKTCIFKFVAFDLAGNSVYDTIDGEDIKSRPKNHINFINFLSYTLIQRLVGRFPLLNQILLIFEEGFEK